MINSVARSTNLTQNTLVKGNELDLLETAGMLMRRDPNLTREDVLFFLVFAAFVFVVIVMTVVTYWTGDMPTFLRMIFGVEVGA
jgi:hypothetical protein